MNNLKVIFMGTPDFAVASLDALHHKSDHTLVSVVTAPDRKAGRGKKMQSSAVKDYAFNNDLNILQPANLKDEGFISKIKSIKPDLIVVVAFRMLPKKLWEIPKYGTINIHASLLPDYRGAAPINHAIMNGEKLTGVTSFFINEKIDTGSIIKQKEVKIAFNEDAGSLHDKLMEKGAELLIETVDLIAKGEVKTKEQSQSDDNIKSANKIFKDDCKINWSDSAIDVYNFIRGLSPYPAAHTYLIDNTGEKHYLKIFKTEIVKNIDKDDKIVSDNSSYLYIKTNDYYLNILELQLQGKKKMDILSFLNGFKIENIIGID